MMAAIYRRRFRVVAGTAALVFGLSAVFDAIVVRAGDYPDRSPWVVAVLVMATSLATLGSTFYAGLLDEVVGGELRDEPPPRFAAVVRNLPWARLVVADLLLTAVTIVFSSGFVLLGAVLFTLFSLVGPMVNIEDHGVLSAFRRSAQLVWPHFVLVFVMVALPLAAEHAIVHSISTLLEQHSIPELFGWNAVFGIAVGSVVGLAEVVIAYSLIIRDHVKQVDGAAAAASPAS
jgi:hypothetical protein